MRHTDKRESRYAAVLFSKSHIWKHPCLTSPYQKEQAVDPYKLKEHIYALEQVRMN